jgi:hypothetical protein
MVNNLQTPRDAYRNLNAERQRDEFFADLARRTNVIAEQRRKEAKASEDADASALPTSVLKFHELLEQESTSASTPMVIADMFPSVGISVVAGDSTIGKSALVLQMAACVAGGVPFLGKQTTKGKVLIIDWENGNRISGILSQVAKAAGVDDIDLRVNVEVMKSPRPDEVVKYVREHKPALVTLDALRWLMDGNESKTDLVAQRFRMLSECQTSWVLVHHLRKTSRDSVAPDLADGDTPVVRWFQEASGSLAITNQSFTRMGVVAPSKGADLLIRWVVKLKGEMGPLHVERLLEDDDPDTPLGYGVASSWQYLSDAVKRRYTEVAGQTVAFPALVTKFGKTQAWKLVKGCEGAGVVEKVSAPGGKGKPWYGFKPIPEGAVLPQPLIEAESISF